MQTSSPEIIFPMDSASVRVFRSSVDMGRAASELAASILAEAVAEEGQARLVVATGPSQDKLIHALVRRTDIEWSKLAIFHMDEYIGIANSHPASFRRWLQTRVTDVVRPGVVHYLNGDAPDWEREANRYAGLLDEHPVDLCFVGFGENGHIAFNDPAWADFDDPCSVKRVQLDERCRQQQVGEGHFANLNDVPTDALTVTCRTIMNCQNLICFVPETRKARAVCDALQGPVSTACPASIVKTHPRVSIFLDTQSASLLMPSQLNTAGQL
jgi:glucosamine-6-phosphate deaminase